MLKLTGLTGPPEALIHLASLRFAAVDFCDLP